MEMKFTLEVTQENIDAILNFSKKVEEDTSCCYNLLDSNGEELNYPIYEVKSENVLSIICEICECDLRYTTATENYFEIRMKPKGEKRTTYDVIVDSFDFAGSKSDNESKQESKPKKRAYEDPAHADVDEEFPF